LSTKPINETESGVKRRKYSFGEFVLDLDRGSLQKHDVDVPLRPKCFEVLKYLVEYPGVLITKDELLTAVWAGVVVTEDSLTQCLIQIRKALGDSSKVIVRTVPRRGYLFDIPVEVHEPFEASSAKATLNTVSRNRRPSRWSVSVAVVLALAIAATWWSSRTHEMSHSANIPVASTTSVGHNPAAFETFLKGKFFYDRRGTGDNERAIVQFRQALDIDPELTVAWVGLAGSIRVQIMQQEIPWEEGWSQFKTMLDKALALDPNDADVHIRLASYYFAIGEEGNSRQHFDRALQLGQNSALVLSAAAGDAMYYGDINAAINLQRRAARLDPLGYTNHGNLAHYLYYGGYYDEARDEWRNAAALNPEYSDESNWAVGLTWIMQGKYGEAEAVIQQLPPGAEKDQGMALIHFARGERTEFNLAVARLSTGTGFDSAFYLAEIYSFQGKLDQSFRWLEVAIDRILESDLRLEYSDDFELLKVCPFLAPMRKDPRWVAWLVSVEERANRI